jgi:hypothetical protein
MEMSLLPQAKVFQVLSYQRLPECLSLALRRLHHCQVCTPISLDRSRIRFMDLLNRFHLCYHRHRHTSLLTLIKWELPLFLKDKDKTTTQGTLIPQWD